MGKLISDAAKKNGSTPIRLKFWAVLRPFFTVNEQRKTAWSWLVLMLALLVLESGVLVAFSYTQVWMCVEAKATGRAGHVKLHLVCCFIPRA